MLAMLIFRCCSSDRAKKSIEWDILLIMACSVVFGKAVLNHGIADKLAGVITMLSGGNPFVLLFVICFTAMIAAEFFNSSATSAVFFPIVYQSAMSIGCDPLPFCIALMLAVSAAFASPVGSSTMLMVYSPGSYNFKDLLRIGVPMKIITLFAIVFIISAMYLL